MADLFTLCVPTKNRPEFLARLLNYYAQAGYRHWIFIGDASDPGPAERNRAAAESFRGKLHVRYFDQPGLNVVESLESLSQAAPTPYCSWVCDDDFLCAGGIERCLDFLESQGGGYAAVHGLGILIQLAEPGPTGTLVDLRPYPPAVLEQETASERLRAHLNRGSPSFHMAVRRTGQFHEMVKGFGRMKGARQGFLFDELILSSLAAIQGKVKILDCLYLVRQAHGAIYRQVNGYDWITHPDWHPSFSVFRELLGEALSKRDPLSREEADLLVKEAFWPYLADLLAGSWQKQQKPTDRLEGSGVRELAKRLPGLKSAWRWFRFRIHGGREEMSLPSLLKSASPYHADFMPIYQTVTHPPPSLRGHEVPEAISMPGSGQDLQSQSEIASFPSFHSGSSQ